MEELLNYYANLLIVQYNGKPKAKATIEMLTKINYGVTDTPLLLQIQNAFDWKTAKGKQLDIIGKWVGITRFYKGTLFWGDTFLSYPNANDLVPTDETDTYQHGYSDYSTFNTDTGNVLTYENLGLVEQSLGDEDYRTVIGLKILKNSIIQTAKNIDDAIWEYFNHIVYTTWTDMKLTYHYPASMTTVMEVCNSKKVLPAPTGVKIILRAI